MSNLQKVLITGASRGIGHAMAELFARSNYDVFAVYNSTLPSFDFPNITPIKADLRIKSEITQILQKAGDVDILINNAGIAQYKMFQDITEEDWDDMLSLNLKSAFLISQMVLPHMLNQKSGCIINLSSIWGITGGACEVHYSAAKAGIIGMTKALAKELGPSKIRVNCIAPGAVETDMLSSLTVDERANLIAQTPLESIGTTNQIAHAALFLAQNEFITGEVLNINGGLHI